MNTIARWLETFGALLANAGSLVVAQVRNFLGAYLPGNLGWGWADLSAPAAGRGAGVGDCVDHRRAVYGNASGGQGFSDARRPGLRGRWVCPLVVFLGVSHLNPPGVVL